MEKKWHISRRRMLKGMGACIALPMLEAMVPKGLSAYHFFEKEKTLRTAFLFMPNGVHPHKWTPEGLGKQFELSPLLKPLGSLKNDILVLGQLMNKNSSRTKDGHYTKTANFLTSERIYNTTGANVNSGGISVDQIIAQHYADQTLFPSLEYGIDRVKSGIDEAVGLTRLYGSAISWKNPKQPNAKEIDPRMAFDRLFGGMIPGKTPKQESKHKKSVLDAVWQDAKDLQRNVGVADQNKLAEYLDAIRSVEKRLENRGSLKDFEAGISDDIKKELIRVNLRLDEYAEYASGVDVTEKVQLMMDIIALAFWSDASRVSTFMFGNSVSGRNFSFLEGVNGNHHSISHHRNDPRLMVQYEKIGIWHIEQYAYLLNRLRNMQEGDSNVLDNSMILFGSGLRDGNRHSNVNLPIVLAGRAGGKLDTGKHIEFEERTPLANLYLSMLRALGIESNEFGDSERVLTEIYA